MHFFSFLEQVFQSFATAADVPSSATVPLHLHVFQYQKEWEREWREWSYPSVCVSVVREIELPDQRHFRGRVSHPSTIISQNISISSPRLFSNSFSTS